MKWLFAGIYVIVLSIFAFAVMGVDKRRAIKNEWRISEKMLLLTAFFGGGIGSLLGMAVFRHKTKHKKFTVGVPLLTVLSYSLIITILIFI